MRDKHREDKNEIERKESTQPWCRQTQVKKKRESGNVYLTTTKLICRWYTSQTSVKIERQRRWTSHIKKEKKKKFDEKEKEKSIYMCACVYGFEFCFTLEMHHHHLHHHHHHHRHLSIHRHHHHRHLHRFHLFRYKRKIIT